MESFIKVFLERLDSEPVAQSGQSDWLLTSRSRVQILSGSFYIQMGRQKEARQNRLITEIYNFVCVNPGVGSAAIYGYLAADLKMRNAGLTARKIGFFIPRYCKKYIRFEERGEGRMYFPIESLDNKIEDI